MALLRYLRQYRIGDMVELLRNERTPPAEWDGRLDGKTVVITGTTSGIGLEAARLFAARGADLVCLNRDPGKSAALEEELWQGHGRTVRTILTDFSSLERTRAAALELLSLDKVPDALVLNAGVYYKRLTPSPEGPDIVFQVNHLAPFMLLYLLKEKLRAGPGTRVVFVNSEGHRFALGGIRLDDLDWKRRRYTGFKSYGASKTAQLLCMRRFADYFSGSATTVNAMHPGNVATNIGNNNDAAYRAMKKAMVQPTAKDPRESAKALLWLVGSPGLAGTSGRFYNMTAEERPAPHARDDGAVGGVWAKSLELCGLS